jgi:hypothetical protein
MEVARERRGAVESDSLAFYRPEARGWQPANGWHWRARRSSVMAGEGGTARCRAVRAVTSRIGQRRGRVRGSSGGAEATASLTTRATCVVPGSSARRAGRRRGAARRGTGGSARSLRGPARQLAVVVGLVLDSGACDSSACSSCWLVLE